MSTPAWLRPGETVRDQDGEQWRITEVGVRRVELGHPDRSAHEVLRSDLLEWVDSGQWQA